jgi:hypothetical protein
MLRALTTTLIRTPSEVKKGGGYYIRRKCVTYIADGILLEQSTQRGYNSLDKGYFDSGQQMHSEFVGRTDKFGDGEGNEKIILT